MGAHHSSLSVAEIDEIQEVSVFSRSEIKRLYKRFKRLDKDDSGTISTDEFLSIPELAMNPLVMRVISIFDSNNDDQVNFKQFVRTLSVFSKKATPEDKLLFAFKVYDLNDDGFIDDEELFQVLKMMVGTNLSEEQLNQIVDKTIAECDLDGDGKVCFEEFSQMLEGVDLGIKMSIRF